MIGINIYIIPETLGQFTGLLDKNGKEIYEGDIINVTVFDCFNNDTQHILKVSWRGTEFVGQNGEDKMWNLQWLHSQDSKIEVIDNIHDNPELMKEVEQ